MIHTNFPRKTTVIFERGVEFWIHNTVKLSTCVRKTNCENCQVTREAVVVKAIQHKCFQCGVV